MTVFWHGLARFAMKGGEWVTQYPLRPTAKGEMPTEAASWAWEELKDKAYG